MAQKPGGSRVEASFDNGASQTGHGHTTMTKMSCWVQLAHDANLSQS